MKLNLCLSLEWPEIEKVFVEQLNKKAKARKAEAQIATKPGEVGVTSIRTNGGGSNGPAPKKGWTDMFCKRCKQMVGPTVCKTPTSVARLIRVASKG